VVNKKDVLLVCMYVFMNVFVIVDINFEFGLAGCLVDTVAGYRYSNK
jgi:hypothetical protein